MSPFNDPQTEARRTIPHYRILLETDSSYMPVSLHHGTNTSISGRYSPYRCSPQTSINGGLACPHSGQRLDQQPLPDSILEIGFIQPNVFVPQTLLHQPTVLNQSAPLSQPSMLNQPPMLNQPTMLNQPPMLNQPTILNQPPMLNQPTMQISSTPQLS